MRSYTTRSVGLRTWVLTSLYRLNDLNGLNDLNDLNDLNGLNKRQVWNYARRCDMGTGNSIIYERSLYAER